MPQRDDNMANSFIQKYRALNPTDVRSDAELTLLIGGKYPEYFTEFPDFGEDYQSLISAKEERERPTLGQKIVTQPIGSFIRGAANVVSEVPGAIATGAQALERKALEAGIPGASAERAYGDVDEQYLTGMLSKKIRDVGDAISPDPVKGLEDSLWSTKVPQGVGSTVGFFAGGLAGRALKLNPIAATALLGSATGASSQYREAVEHGANTDQAIGAWLAGAGVGTSEAVPLASLFNKLNRLSGGTFMRKIGDAAVESVEEALQEGFQSAAGDVIASKWAGYDPDRNLFEDVGENMVVGGVSGAVVTMLASFLKTKIPDIATADATDNATKKMVKDRVNRSARTNAYSGEPPSDTKVDSYIDLAVKEQNNTLTVAEEETIRNMSPDNKTQYALVKTSMSREFSEEEQRKLDREIAAERDAKISELEQRLAAEVQALDAREEQRAQIEQQAAEQRRQDFEALQTVGQPAPVVGGPTEGGEVDEGQVQRQGQEVEVEAQTTGDDIPIGLERPPVRDEALASMSAEEFSGHSRKIKKQLWEAESDEAMEGMDSAARQRLADLQDQFTAVELEQHRRKVNDTYAGDLFFEARQLIKKLPTKNPQLSEEFEKLRNIFRELNRQGVTLTEAAQGDAADIAPKLTTDKDFREVLGSTYQDLKDLLPLFGSDAPPLGRVETPGEPGAVRMIPPSAVAAEPTVDPADTLDQLRAKRQEIAPRVSERLEARIQELEQQVAEQQAPATEPAPVSATDAKMAEIKARQDAIKARIRAKLGQTSSGVDPEIAVLAAELAFTYVEMGVVKFVDFARRIKSEMGDMWQPMQPYLRNAWNQAADNAPTPLPEVSRAEAGAILDQVDKEPAEAEADVNADQPTESSGGGGIDEGDTTGGVDQAGEAEQAAGGVVEQGGGVQPGVRPASERPDEKPGGRDSGEPDAHRFSRISTGEGATNAQITQNFNSLVGALSRDGAKMAILDQSIARLANEAFSNIGGVYDRDRDIVTLLMNDVHKPTLKNLLTAMEEAAHRFFALEPQHIQKAIVDAVKSIPDSQLGLQNVLQDPQVGPDSTLDPLVQAEERFVKAVSESIDPTIARSLARRFFDFIRELYFRVALEFQAIAAGLNVGQVNPDTAKEYAALRLHRFIDGGPMRGIYSFFGRTPDEWEMAPAFETAYGMSYYPTKFNHQLQAYEWQPAVADSIEAMLMNDRNVRYAHAYVGNRAGNTVSPDLLPSQAVVDVVANNEFKGVLGRLFEKWDQSGANKTATGQKLFTTEREFSDYLMLRSRQNHPDDIVEAKRQVMQSRGQDITPGLTVADVAVHTKTLATSSAHIMAGRLASNLGKRHTQFMSTIDQKGRRLDKVQDRLTRLTTNWRDADTMVAEVRDGITESLRSLFAGLTQLNRTGKASSRLAEIIGEIEGRIDRPIAQQYAVLFNRVFKRRKGDRDFSNRLFDIVQKVAADERFDWQNMSVKEVRAALRQMAEADPKLLGGLGGTSPDNRAITTIVAHFLITNGTAVELLRLRQQRLEEGEAKDLAEAFKSLIRGGRQNLKALKTEINKFGRTQKALARAIAAHEQLADERDQLKNDLQQAEQFSLAYRTVHPVLDAEIDRLGGVIGATKNIAGPNQQFDAVPGSKFRVPLTDRAAVQSDFTTMTFSQSTDGDVSKGVADAVKKIERWLYAVGPDDPRFGGSIYQEMYRYAQKIREFRVYREHRTRLSDETMKILGSMFNNLWNIDLPESKGPARRLTRFQEIHVRYQPMIENLSARWVDAKHEAMVALGIERNQRGDEYFYELFHDRPMNYISSRTDIRDAYTNPVEAEARAIQETIAVLRRDPATAPMLNDTAVRALSNFWLASRDSSAIFSKIAKDENVKIPDEADPGYLRDVIGAPLFEVRRVPSSKLKMVYSNMKKAGWGELFPSKPDSRIEYENDPDALRQRLAPMFTPYVWEHFLGEFANDPAKSVFMAPDGRASVSTTNAARAWAETQDPVSFAERLHELEGGTPDGLSSFVAETLGTMRDYYKMFVRLQPQTADDVMGVTSDGAMSVLMSGRVMNDLPPGLVQNRRYNSLVMHSLLNGIAYTAAFGHMNAAIKNEFNQLTDALRDERLEYQELSNDAYRNTMGKGKRAHRAEMLRLAGSEERMKRLEKSFQAMAAAESASAAFNQFIDHAGGLHYNFQTGQELVSMVSVGAIQGGKTILTDTSSTMKPLQAFGVSKQAFKMSVGALFSEMPRAAIQSVANIFGVDLRVISDEMRRMGKIGIVDPDYQISLFSKFRNNMESIEALPTRPNIIKRGILNVSKGVKAVFSAPVKIGAKVAEDLQGVPAARLVGPYNTFSKISQFSIAVSMIRQYQDMVMKAVQWYDLNGGEANEAFYDIDHRFDPAELGYKNGLWLKDANTYRQMEEYLTHAGTTINDLAVDYIRRAGPAGKRDTSVDLLTPRMFTNLLSLSSTYLTQEKSILTQPEATVRNPGLQIALPLLSWGVRQTYSWAQTFRDDKGRRSFWRGVNAMAVMTTVGITWSLLQDWYDDEVLGKQSNVLPLSTDDKQMLAVSIVDRLARVGTLGFIGEGVNYAVNKSTARPFSLDGRLLFANSMHNFISAWSDFYNQDWTGTYSTVWKPLASSMGGTGWLQNIQAFNNLVAEVLPEEAQVAGRINVNNYLRVAGRQLGMDVRVSFGNRSVSTPIRPWVTNMMLSAIANDANGFREAYNRAIQATMKHKDLNRFDAEKSVAQSYRSYHPLQSVFRSSPTRADYLRILGRLDEDGRQDVMDAVRLIDAFGAQIGASPGVKQGRQAAAPRMDRPAFGRSIRELSTDRLFSGNPLFR